MRRLFYLSVLSVLVLGFAACAGDKKKDAPKRDILQDLIEQNPRYASDMTRTAEDTAAVMQLSTQFLDLLQSDQLAAALDMLYETDSTGIKGLSDESRRQYSATFSTMPVLSYKIDEFSLYSETDTEVRFTWKFMEDQEGSTIPNVMKGSLCPVRQDGRWYLTIPGHQYVIDKKVTE